MTPHLPIYSVVIPVYNTAAYVTETLRIAEELTERAGADYGVELEFIFVVDASPDDSLARFSAELPRARIRSQLILHSRNFGSFAAIRTGLMAGHGDFFGVIAADLQEPPELLLGFLERMLGGETDVVVGRREARDDPAASEASARLFWWFYRRLVLPDIPPGGVDVFACTRAVRDHLVRFPEVGSALVGQLFWLGFRRAEIGYARRRRSFGKSGWTFAKKLRYLTDSVFAFTDLPVRLLMLIGLAGLAVATPLAVTVALLRLVGVIALPGYAATMLAILFFGALNTLGIGIVGSYAARAYENTKMRPIAIVQSARAFDGRPNRPGGT